eukprot:284129-Pelagomonas_calceolata.AAC.8
MSGRSSLHGAHSATHACHKAWSAAGRSCCCPGTAYQCRSVSGRTGFASFPAALATLPSLVNFLCNQHQTVVNTPLICARTQTHVHVCVYALSEYSSQMRYDEPCAQAAGGQQWGGTAPMMEGPQLLGPAHGQTTKGC